jgi:hypothetical protein
MPLADQMLSHARFLVDLDPVAPQEVNLRRAVSAAYYAAFHLLSAAVAEQISPAVPLGLRGRTQRALDHGGMAKAADLFKNSGKPITGVPADIGHSDLISQKLARIAGDFKDLQQNRYIADYDILDARNVVNYVWASGYVTKAEQLFLDWKDEQGTDNAKVFLAALMLAGKWGK